MSALLPRFLCCTLAAGALVAACADPVHDQQVAALGPELPGVPPSEFHRAGQPCALCHGDEGPAKTKFAIGGTIFYGPNQQVGAENVFVSMVDSLGTQYKATTNCVGNFFVTPDQWDPAFPVKVQVQQGPTIVRMNSQISRDGSCAGCHKDPANYDTPGHIHLLSSDPQNPFVDPQCPVDPTLPDPPPAAPSGGQQ